jgi:hypothetical protein
VAFVTEKDIFEVTGTSIHKEAFLASDGLVDNKVVVMDDGVGPYVPNLVGPKEIARYFTLHPRLGTTAFMQITFNGDNRGGVFIQYSNKG